MSRISSLNYMGTDSIEQIAANVQGEIQTLEDKAVIDDGALSAEDTARLVYLQDVVSHIGAVIDYLNAEYDTHCAARIRRDAFREYEIREGAI